MKLRATPTWYRQNGWRLIILSLTLAQAYVLYQSSQEQTQENARYGSIAAKRNQKRPSYSQMQDPPVGSTIDSINVFTLDGQKQQLPAPYSATTRKPTPIAIVFIGSCVPCVAEKLKQWQSAAASGLPVCVIAQGEAEEIKTFIRENSFSMPFYIESSESRAAKNLNVAWHPRAYVVNEKNRLQLLQGVEEDTYTIVKRFKRLGNLKLAAKR